MRLRYFFLFYFLNLVHHNAWADYQQLKTNLDNPGNLNAYLYLPEKKSPKANLIVYLHGCTETAQDARQVGFEKLADANGFLVLYIETQLINNTYRCFNWYAEDDISRSGGELESISTIIADTVTKQQVNKVFIAGFSAGGYMAAAFAAVYPERVEAAAVISAGPYRCATEVYQVVNCTSGKVNKSVSEWVELVKENSAAREWPALISIHGANDSVVDQRNQIQLIKQWVGLLGLKKSQRKSTKHLQMVTFKKAKKLILKQITIKKLKHAVPVQSRRKCGSANKYRVESDLCAAEEIYDFFKLQ